MLARTVVPPSGTRRGAAALLPVPSGRPPRPAGGRSWGRGSSTSLPAPAAGPLEFSRRPPQGPRRVAALAVLLTAFMAALVGPSRVAFADVAVMPSTLPASLVRAGGALSEFVIDGEIVGASSTVALTGTSTGLGVATGGGMAALAGPILAATGALYVGWKLGGLVAPDRDQLVPAANPAQMANFDWSRVTFTSDVAGFYPLSQDATFSQFIGPYALQDQWVLFRQQRCPHDPSNPYSSAGASRAWTPAEFRAGISQNISPAVGTIPCSDAEPVRWQYRFIDSSKISSSSAYDLTWSTTDARVGPVLTAELAPAVGKVASPVRMLVNTSECLGPDGPQLVSVNSAPFQETAEAFPAMEVPLCPAGTTRTRWRVTEVPTTAGQAPARTLVVITYPTPAEAPDYADCLGENVCAVAKTPQPDGTVQCSWGAHLLPASDCQADPTSNPTPIEPPVDPADADCFGKEISLAHPSTWVLGPLKCAFLPSDATKAKVSDVGAQAGAAVPFSYVTDAVGWVRAALSPPAGACLKLGANVGPFGNVTMLDTCTPGPIEGILAGKRNLIGVALYVGLLAPLAWWAWRTYAPGTTASA